jgi:hypothetical protein
MTDDTDNGTLTELEENVRRDIGPEFNLEAAVMADKVEGAREPSVVGSATTSVD